LTLSATKSQGDLYSSQGKLVEAEVLYLEVLKGYEKLNVEYILTLNTYNNLGVVYSSQGKLIEAEEMYLRASMGYKMRLGSHHILTLNTVNCLRRTYGSQDNKAKAEATQFRTSMGKEVAWDLHHPATSAHPADLNFPHSSQLSWWKLKPCILITTTRWRRIPSIFSRSVR
jgi:tetratricopeptide (TPR) repeat protein